MARRVLSVSRRVVLAALFALPVPVHAADAADGLRVSWPVDGAITGAAVLVTAVGELGAGTFGPGACRWCDPPAFDKTVRNALRWGNPNAAATASDAMVVAAPLGVFAYDLLAARRSGDGTQAVQDVLVIMESIAVTTAITEVAKYATARERPSAWYGAPGTSRGDHLSFWSGHTSAAFAAAAAGGTIGRMRGYSGWPWVYAAGFTGAGVTGYLRLGADRHWLGDVVAGAAVGTATGILIPWLHRDGRSGTSMRVIPAPGGFVIAGLF